MISNKTIAALQAAFSNVQILLPDSELYQKQNGSYLSGQESDIQPACIFQPKTKEDVSHFVQSIKPLAINGEMAFAIRGAGNMPLPGCANIQAGITLDLSQLNDIELNDGVVSIGAGARWGAVNEKVQAAGLAVTGGRSGTGGIGGLALAGVYTIWTL
jgi:FAD/FMN-containing dehydrogenase